MITITNNAAEEIKLSLNNPDTKGMLLRFAVKKNKNNWRYLMGFDEINKNDIHLKSNDIEYIIAYEHKQLLAGTTVDYEKIDEEIGYGFIFLNPNDPNYIQPTEI